VGRLRKAFRGGDPPAELKAGGEVISQYLVLDSPKPPAKHTSHAGGTRRDVGLRETTGGPQRVKFFRRRGGEQS